MDNKTINLSKIKAAGRKLTIIGYVIIAMIVFSLLQFLFSITHDIISVKDLKLLATFTIILNLVCVFLIVVNLIDAGISLSTCEVSIIENNNTNKINFRKYNNLSNGIFPNYSEDTPIEQTQILGTKFHTIQIHFEGSFSDFYNYYPNKNKFSYNKNYKGEVFFDLKEDCLNDLFEDRIRNK